MLSKAKFFTLGLVAYLVALVFFGYWQKGNEPLNQINIFNGQKVEIVGLIDDVPEQRLDKQKVVLAVEYKDDIKISGRVLITTTLWPKYHYGDKLAVRCTLQKAQEINSFNYWGYLAKSNIYSICRFATIEVLARSQGNFFKQKIFDFKKYLEDLVDKNLSEPQASIILAITLGSKRTLPEEVSKHFNTTATTHIMAISGMNITILLVLMSEFFIFLNITKRKSFWLNSSLLFLYITLIGYPASAVRAAIMGWIIFFALSYGRVHNSFNVILLAAAIMLSFNPKSLFYDIGFQLSFLAVLGILEFNGFFEKCLNWMPNILGSRTALSLTLSAQLATAPLILFYFQQFSLIGFVANVLVAPVLPYLMFFSLAGFIVGSFFSELAFYAFLPIYFILEYVLKIVELLSQVPYAAVNF